MAKNQVGGTSEGSGSDVKTDKYSRAVKLVFFFLFCESFCYMAMKSEIFNNFSKHFIIFLPQISVFLLQYLTKKLLLKPEEALTFYHYFVALSCFYSIIGHIVSMSRSKFSTILISANIFLAGSLVLALTSIEKLGLQSG